MLEANKYSVRMKSIALGCFFLRLMKQVRLQGGSFLHCKHSDKTEVAVVKEKLVSLPMMIEQGHFWLNFKALLPKLAQRSSFAFSQTFISLKFSQGVLHFIMQECGSFGFSLLSPEDPEERGSQINFCHKHGYAIIQVDGYHTSKSHVAVGRSKHRNSVLLIKMQTP